MTAKKKKFKKIKQEQTVVKPIEEQVISKNTTKLPAWLPVLFMGLAFLLYFQCIPYGFVLDDKIVYSENSFTKKGFDGIGDILSKETFQGYFGEQKDLVEGGRYRPLSLVSFAIEHQFFGLNQNISHTINIILYGLCGWLIFLVLFQLLGINNKEKWWWSIPFLATIIYLVHPVHTEAVANIKGRDEIMAMIFALLTLRHSIKYVEKGTIVQLILVGIFYFLGLLSKENVITFLAAIPLALWMFKKSSKKRIFTIGGYLFGISLAYLFTRWKVIGYIVDGTEITDIMNNPFYGMKTAEKYGSILYTLFEYLRLSVIPQPLTHDYYPYHIPKVGFGHWKVVLSVLMHLGLVIYSLVAFKKNKVVSFGIWFYIITISIVSNLVVGVGTFMNERFIFISSLGICMILAWALIKGSEKINPKIVQGMAVVLILLFSAKTITRVPVWESALTLNTAAVKVSKNSARSNSFMATALFNQFQATSDRPKKIRLLNEANVYADQALKILPAYSNGNLMKAGIEAELYKLDGDLDRLLRAFKSVIIRQPQIGFITEYCEYLNGRADASKMINFYHDVGFNVLFNQRKLNWAVHFLNMANSLDPNNATIRKDLYECYMAAGNSQKAQEYK